MELLAAVRPTEDDGMFYEESLIDGVLHWRSHPAESGLQKTAWS